MHGTVNKWLKSKFKRFTIKLEDIVLVISFLLCSGLFLILTYVINFSFLIINLKDNYAGVDENNEVKQFIRNGLVLFGIFMAIYCIMYNNF